MKRFSWVLIIAVLISLGYSNLNAQRSKSYVSYQNVISIDPLEFLINRTLYISFEHKTAPANSFTIFLMYHNYSTDWDGFGVGGSYRWYLDIFKDKKIPLEGLYVGPVGALSMFRNKWADNSHVYLSIGGEIGYKWIFGGFSVEPLVRLMFGVTDVAGLGYHAWGAGVNLGYAW